MNDQILILTIFSEVKVEITDDYAILKPNCHGHFEFYLLSNETSTSADLKAGNTLRATARKKQKRFMPTVSCSF